jgi:hypothetical protein
MTIFLDTKATNTKDLQCALENVHRIAAEIERTYCPLPDFQVNFYKTIPNYWRAFKESCGSPNLLIEVGYDSMMVDAELLEEETEKLPPAFEWQNTLHFAPFVWPDLATLPSTGVRTHAQWLAVLICAHELLHLHPHEQPERAVPGILEEALVDLGAMDLLLYSELSDTAYFAAHQEEWAKRVNMCMNYISSLDTITGVWETPRLLATLLLWAAEYDCEVAYARFYDAYCAEIGLDDLIAEFWCAIEEMAAALSPVDLHVPERVFDANEGLYNPLLPELVQIFIGYYGHPIQQRWHTTALLALLDLGHIMHSRETALPSMEALQEQLEGLLAT